MQTLGVSLFALSLASGSQAASIQTTYSLNLGAGTLNGNNVTSIAVFETDGALVSLDFPFTIGSSGLHSITHASLFQPTLSLIVGLDLNAPLPGDGKTHVLFFTSDAFAQGANGVLFSQAFPHTWHNDFITDCSPRRRATPLKPSG